MPTPAESRTDEPKADDTSVLRVEVSLATMLAMVLIVGGLWLLVRLAPREALTEHLNALERPGLIGRWRARAAGDS